MLGDPDEVPPVPDEGDVYVKQGDLWPLGEHRLLCRRCDGPRGRRPTARLCGAALLATDPPYGVLLDPTWRDGVYNEPRPGRAAVHAHPEGHRNTTLSGDTRVTGAMAFALVPSLEVGYVWHAESTPRRWRSGSNGSASRSPPR